MVPIGALTVHSSYWRTAFGLIVNSGIIGLTLIVFRECFQQIPQDQQDKFLPYFVTQWNVFCLRNDENMLKLMSKHRSDSNANKPAKLKQLPY